MPADKDDFSQPRIAINRVYTRRGDHGQTSLAGGRRLAKDDPRIEAYGTVDELNSCIGMSQLRAGELGAQFAQIARLATTLRRVQHELFNLGAILAVDPDQVGERQPHIRQRDIDQLEREIDDANAGLPPLRSFVLPGGSRLAVELDHCRTVCRRAERCCVRLAHAEAVDPPVLTYLNRLSDALFVWSRMANQVQRAAETLWDPNVGPGQP